MRSSRTRPGHIRPARVSMLAGLLFLMVGVLGMHVLPGAHNTPGHTASPAPATATHAGHPFPALSPATDSGSSVSQEVAPGSSVAQPAEGEAAGAVTTMCQPTAADPDWLIPSDALETTVRPESGTLPHTTNLTTQIIRPPSLIQLSIIRT
ncbi:hypothetical protein [Arthrobacter pigmenti]